MKNKNKRTPYTPKFYYMSRRMGKPTICIGENKGADQLRSNCEADQRLCFRYTDSAIPALLKGKHYYLIPAYDFHETSYASR